MKQSQKSLVQNIMYNAPVHSVAGIGHYDKHQHHRRGNTTSSNHQRNKKHKHPEGTPAGDASTEKSTYIRCCQGPLHLQFQHDAGAAEQRGGESRSEGQRAEYDDLQTAQEGRVDA